VRPRLAELHRQGEIANTGDHRPGDSGLAQTVWRVSEPLPDYAHISGVRR
jgi:hypothetical protein